jgi:hypothetical protein
LTSGWNTVFMAQRDRRKISRTKKIITMQAELRKLLPAVLKQVDVNNEQSLNAIIGHKTNFVIDLKNEVINSPEHYVLLWTEGFRGVLERDDDPSFRWLFNQVKRSPALKKYLDTFLRRSYLKHFEELHKRRPRVEEAEVWIGQNHANYGLLVAPRFAHKQWENDKSEIRHFRPKYWSIGHVLETGLVIPDKKSVMPFSSVKEYLRFFEHVLVRGTGSSHQRKIAAMYSDYVHDSDDPKSVPLLIPEYRYDGRDAKHKYRLDFCIIDADTMDKVGFELSPWSTHGSSPRGARRRSRLTPKPRRILRRRWRSTRAFFGSTEYLHSSIPIVIWPSRTVSSKTSERTWNLAHQRNS